MARDMLLLLFVLVVEVSVELVDEVARGEASMVNILKLVTSLELEET